MPVFNIWKEKDVLHIKRKIALARKMKKPATTAILRPAKHYSLQ